MYNITEYAKIWRICESCITQQIMPKCGGYVNHIQHKQDMLYIGCYVSHVQHNRKC